MILLRESRLDGPPDSAAVWTLPVADRAMVGLAVGLAIGGRRPVVELSSTGRLPAVWEALLEAASVAAAGEFQVPLVVRVPYGGEAGARVDRPLGDLPEGLRVLCASTTGMVDTLTEAADGPVLLLVPRALPRGEGAEARARVVREGTDVTVLTWGAGVGVALEAAEQSGASVEVVDLVSLAPLDRTVGERVRRTGRVVVVHPEDGGLAERLLRVALHEAFLYLESPPAAARQQVEAVAAAIADSVRY